MLNVDSHGNVSSFSPELLGMKNKDYGDFLLGNININSLAEIHAACLGSALYRDIRDGVQACERLRVFLGLRRRLAGQQAVRERQRSPARRRRSAR